MPLLDQTHFDKLVELAKTRFRPVLKKAEMRVLHDSASSENLTPPKRGVKRPVVRADFLRWLATDPEAASCIDPQGLRIFAATIPGKLDLRNCYVNSILDFQYCEFQGEINLQSAETRGICIFDSSLSNGVCADRVIVHGPLFLRHIVSAGEIRLLGAEITGQLACSGAKLRAKGDALSVDGAQIGGGVFLGYGFESDGEIRLLSAEITGNLECTGAKLKAKGNALSADNAKISGNVFLRAGFESEGTIRMPGAEITGQLSCTGARLKAKGNALSADGAKIDGDVFLHNGFESEGEIRLLGAEIGGNLSFSGAKVARVVCQNMVITGDLIWQRIGKTKETEVNLVGAKVKNLRDDKDSWPVEENLNLDGLVYEELTLHDSSSKGNIKAGHYAPELPLKAKERIEWLMLQHSGCRTEPQPWMQLRDLLERKGDHKGAKYVLFRLRCLQAKEKKFTPLLWLLGLLSFFWKVAKHIFGSPIASCRRVWPYFRHPNRSWGIAFAWVEENPFRIGYSIAATLLIGTCIFTWGGSNKAMIETVRSLPNAVTDNGKVKPISPHYPKYQPFIYTLENAVPPVKLGMDDKWAPDPSPEFCRAWLPRFPWFYFISTYGVLVFSRWALIVWGWVQATVLVAALAERFKK